MMLILMFFPCLLAYGFEFMLEFSVVACSYFFPECFSVFGLLSLQFVIFWVSANVQMSWKASSKRQLLHSEFGNELAYLLIS